MAISAKEVGILRKQTGAPMMDCKKALVEADGDFDKAVEILRKKGQKVSEKRSGRDASEGSIFAMAGNNGSNAVMIELNSETDFVALNSDFQDLGKKVLDIAFDNMPSDVDALKGLDMDGRSVAEQLTDAMGRIGEKIDLRRYISMDGDAVVTYIHPGARVGVLVAFEGVGEADIQAAGRNVAMQIAAMRPTAVDDSGITEEIKERELRIGREKALAEGKPENLVDRIAQGSLKKYMKENTLVNQAYVKDSSMTVAQYLKQAGPDLKVKSFSRMELGGN